MQVYKVDSFKKQVDFQLVTNGPARPARPPRPTALPGRRAGMPGSTARTSSGRVFWRPGAASGTAALTNQAGSAWKVKMILGRVKK